MDYLLTAVAIALVFLAAWLLYKRWVGRYKTAPAPEEFEDDEPEAETAPIVQTATAEPPVKLEAVPETEEK